MLKDIKKTARHIVIYSLGNVSQRLVGLILLPLYTSHLTTSEYGILAVLEITSQFIVETFSLSLATALMRWSTQEKDINSRKSILFTATSFTLVLSLLVSLAFIPLSSQFSELFFNNLNFSDYFLILFISSSIGIYNKIPLAEIRLQERSSFYLVTNTFRFVVILGLNIYFVAILQIGVKGIVLSTLIGNAIVAILTLPVLLRGMNFSFNLQILKEMLRFSFPLIFSTISAMVYSIGDRYILGILLDYSSVGIYSLGYKLGSTINAFVLQSFYLGFIPLAFKKLGSKDEGRYLSKVLTYFTFVLVASALVLSLFGQEAIELFTSNKDYWEAIFIVPFIAFAFVLKGIYQVFNLGFQYAKKTSYQAYIFIIAAMFNLALNFLLIPHLGIYGSAVSSVATYGIMTFVSYHYSSRLYFIPYEIKKVFLLLILGIILFFAALFVFKLDMVYRVPIKALILISFPFILKPLHFYEDIELVRIKQSIKKWRNPSNWPFYKKKAN